MMHKVYGFLSVNIYCLKKKITQRAKRDASSKQCLNLTPTSSIQMDVVKNWNPKTSFSP